MTVVLTRTIEPHTWTFSNIYKIDETLSGEIRLFNLGNPNTPTHVKKDTIITIELDVWQTAKRI